MKKVLGHNGEKYSDILAGAARAYYIFTPSLIQTGVGLDISNPRIQTTNTLILFY